MKLKKTLLTICALVLFSSAVFADSPLTSTDFSKAYSEVPIIIVASKTEGYLTNQLMDYLTEEKNPIDLKMAVINELGWQFKGKNNTRTFIKYLSEKRGYADEKEFLEKGKADELLAVAYMKGLDDYFDVKNTLLYAEKALKQNPNSRTYNLIAGLLKAQKAMDDSWCKVYQITDNIRKNDKLENDLKPEAVKIIYDYMDIYGEYCS